MHPFIVSDLAMLMAIFRVKLRDDFLQSGFLPDELVRATRTRTERAIGLRQFPYSLYFSVDETENKVRVLSCFHQHRSPSSRP
jgi:hypothetical protein